MKSKWTAICSVLVTVAMAAQGCSSKSSAAAPTVPQFQVFQDGLNGTPDQVVVTSTVVLSHALSPADWYYLSNAALPTDATTFLADPRVQKAIKAFAFDFSAAAQTSAAEATAKVQALLDRARPILSAMNGNTAAILWSPAPVSAFAYVAATEYNAPFPTAGAPMDATVDQRTTAFYVSGVDVPMYQGAAPCCVATVTFPGGSFNCTNATSCQGKGEPASGGLTIVQAGSSSSGSSSGSSSSGGTSPGTNGCTGLAPGAFCPGLCPNGCTYTNGTNSSGGGSGGGAACLCAYGGGQARSASCAAGYLGCPNGVTCCPAPPGGQPAYLGSDGQCYDNTQDACNATGSCPLQMSVTAGYAPPSLPTCGKSFERNRQVRGDALPRAWRGPRPRPCTRSSPRDPPGRSA